MLSIKSLRAASGYRPAHQPVTFSIAYFIFRKRSPGVDGAACQKTFRSRLELFAPQAQPTISQRSNY